MHNNTTLTRMLRKLEEVEVTSMQKRHIVSILQREGTETTRDEDGSRLAPPFKVKVKWSNCQVNQKRPFSHYE